ncbi:RNA polymerase sigma factor [Poritiphilus flavus]|uniref:Sigma-70 family RNA polymerase sigma factor n=1 Tax=Poritiphilus flavus TaxID=2697053 RepID=A0A6L9E8B0_9FLAO|nr:sigma-70 family RNA polymerase sigma factor [Poritiphilus flavus]NAS10841.1 sigma-70 family RNA polymerase sigma factor [Poritiphilus flavus]
MTSGDPRKIVDHLFRSEYGKLIAVLAHKFGPSQIELIEDAVQDSLLKAMQVWGYSSTVPDNPTAWLLRVAGNRVIDSLRRSKKLDRKEEFKTDHGITPAFFEEMALESSISDSQLKMIFACCHPSLSQEYQLVLSLKLIGGFSNKELADALLKKEETVAKSFTRAKRRLKEQISTLETPVEIGLQSRLFVVIRVIYLLFSEGYAATTGSLLIKKDICYEAIRLALILRKNPFCQHANLEALIALMCFHASRFEARLDQNSELVDLEHQDRTLYNSELIRIGMTHLENAGLPGQPLSNYHLEAAVAYQHCAAKTFEETNWDQILHLYDLQLKRQYSPMVELNRLVPLLQVKGPEEALQALNQISKQPHFSESGLFYAIKAEILGKLQRFDQAEAALKTAIELSQNELRKTHLKKKLAALSKTTS